MHLTDKLDLRTIINCKSYGQNVENYRYIIIPANPATGILYITRNNPAFISGHLRMRGRRNGRYPYHYLEMIDSVFGSDKNTIEVCSGSVKNCVTVDINGECDPDLVADAQLLNEISDNTFSRWRCDPPYNEKSAKLMYNCDLPCPFKLLRAGTRVIKTGSLMFLLLGPQNYQYCPIGIKRIGWVAITVVPNNELRALHIYYKPHKKYFDIQNKN